MCVNTICCSLQHSEKSLKRRRRLNGHLRSSMWQQQDWDGGRWGCSGYQSSKGNGSVDKKKNQIIVSVEEAVLILNWSSRHPPPANAHPFFYLRGYLDWRRSGCRFLSALKKSWQVSPSFKAPIKIHLYLLYSGLATFSKNPRLKAGQYQRSDGHLQSRCCSSQLLAAAHQLGAGWDTSCDTRVTHNGLFKGESLELLVSPLCVTIDYHVLFKIALNLSVYI